MARNYLIDNAKVIMILFVVFGHLIEPLVSSSTYIKLAWTSIYSFHMPIFVMLAGMVTKLSTTKENTYKLLSSIVIPLVIFTTMYEIFELLARGEFSTYTINFKPYWILWFLFSLFIWKVVLPTFLKLKYPLSVSILLSVCAGYSSQIGYFLGVSRTIYFFPYFIIGFYLTQHNLLQSKFLQLNKLFYIAILILNIMFFVAFIDWPNRWLLGSIAYDGLGANGLQGAITRATLYIVSIITSISILKLIPDVDLAISKLGPKSLYVFLWHGFFVKVFVGVGLLGLISSFGDFVTLIVCLMIASGITWLLSLNFVLTLTNKFLLNPVTILFLEKPSDLIQNIRSRQDRRNEKAP